jgi:molybdate transport system substrate-binding protein
MPGLRKLMLLALLCLPQAPVQAQAVGILAAASLQTALDDIQARLPAGKAVVSYAASSALARQIENGAPADLFISADLDWMDYLDKRRLVNRTSRTNLLRNSLVLVAPVASPLKVDLVPGVALAATLERFPGGGRLAMADPDSVPAGKYGKAALEALGLWQSVSGRLARAENARAALLLVSRGEAPLGIVYRTDALADKGVRIAGTFAASLHPPIVYPAAIVAGSRHPGAPALLAHLRGAEARGIWERHGFVIAE